MGDLGNGKVQVDWAFADYKFSDSFGIRAGKVKTTLGLFTDTQDMEFVHTWALLPQSVYPSDLRATTIAHVGGDLYGELGLKKVGRLAYVVYAGTRPQDPRGGYFLGTRDAGAPINQFTSWAKGLDVRWTLPIEGLTSGYSYYNVEGHGKGGLTSFGGRPVPIPGGLPFRFDFMYSGTHAFYGDYQRGKFRTYGEYWFLNSNLRFSGVPIPPLAIRDASWYYAASYRLHKRLELGSYYSSYHSNRDEPFTPSNSIRGPVASARIDINRYWNVKVEGHFLDGHAAPLSAHSFYPSTNPSGFVRRTNLFLVRSAFSF